jgi:hypothetical protein
MGGLVVDTYVHHYELAIRITLCSLAYLFTIQSFIFIGVGELSFPKPKWARGQTRPDRILQP